MSPGGAMLRVYAALKERIMAGEFAPGEKLDPKRLAADLVISTSPVRDALHRLHGERMIESLRQEGFRQPQIVEPAIRDLYEWSSELMHVVLRAASREGARVDADSEPRSGSYGTRVSECFSRIALQSPNHEHRATVANLLDRTALYRPVEEHVLSDALQDVVHIETAVAQKRWPAAGRALDHFHHRRLRIIGKIAADLRPNSPNDL